METIQPLAHDTSLPPDRRPRGWRRLGLNFLTVSILVHLVLGFAATYFIVQTVQARKKPSFKGNPATSSAPTAAVEHKVQMRKQQNVMSAPPQTKRVTTTGLSKITLPTLPVMPATPEARPATMAGMGATGLSPGGFGGSLGGMGGGGTGAAINFFGLHSSAKRFAFLLDYSGSMSGTFRKEMEKNLVESLGKLPSGTQVLIIPWAGPAWLCNQTAKQVKAKWKKIDNYDNFALTPGAALDTPAWISISPESIKEIDRQMQAQETSPGGTDWRQPFRLAMRARPAPEVIFFMTDGQIPGNTAERALTDINTTISTNGQPPKINCLWIENKAYKPDVLRRLASTYHGEYTTVK